MSQVLAARWGWCQMKSASSTRPFSVVKHGLITIIWKLLQRGRPFWFYLMVLRAGVKDTPAATLEQDLIFKQHRHCLLTGSYSQLSFHPPWGQTGVLSVAASSHFYLCKCPHDVYSFVPNYAALTETKIQYFWSTTFTKDVFRYVGLVDPLTPTFPPIWYYIFYALLSISNNSHYGIIKKLDLTLGFF